ncbi:MAG: M20/M25/M40 family metallo-hydrolase [Planctomycetota bacterium]|nr:M20/M25/M40 family metallo-hydrolase [Planctomycetota bacterium]
MKRVVVCSLAGVLLALAAVICPGFFVFAEEPQAGGEKPIDTITGKELMDHIGFLASDELAGRDTPSKGLDEAAEYIAREFKKYGLKPAGDDKTFFQQFDVETAAQLGRLNSLVVTMPAKEEALAGTLQTKSYAMPADFVPLPFSGTGKVEFTAEAGEMEGNLVFAGYGITDESREYDDYAGLDVDGKIVLVLTHEPQEKDAYSDFSGRKATKWSDPYEKALNAQAHGAAALIVVTDPVNHKDLKPPVASWPQFQTEFERMLKTGIDYLEFMFDEPKTEKTAKKERKAVKIPVLHASGGFANEVFAAAGQNLSKLQKKIDKNCEPCSFELERVGVALETEVVPAKSSRVKNVIALLPGSDPELADEYVIVCAHYDHIGTTGPPEAGKDTISNGADDNASGTAGVVEIAQAFALAQTKPQRSLLFAAWAGEEKGFLGSMHFARHPIVELKGVKVVVNLDMIGRGEGKEVLVTGTMLDESMRKTVEGAAKSLGIEMNYIPVPGVLGFLAGSDHAPFMMKGLRGLHLFAGMHDDYHKVSDSVDKIAPARAESISRLAYLIAERFANPVQ